VPRHQDPKEAVRIMNDAGAIPLEPYTGSQVKWKCKCKKCKEIIYPRLAPVKYRGIGPCQKCAATEMGARRRNQSELKNIAILKKANFVPLEPFPGNSKPWKVRCLKCEKVSRPHLSSVKNGSSCGFCAGIKVDEKDVRKIYREAGFEPIGKYPGKTKTLWKAKHRKCGVVSSPTFQAVKRGGGCRTCSKTLPVTKEIAANLFLKNNLQPLEPYVDTLKPWKSRCLFCNKTVSPNYSKVLQRGHQCSYCAGAKVDESDAIKLMKESGFRPLVSYPGGNKPWKSQCLKCKKISSPNYTRVKIGSGCKFCSNVAVDPKDAVIAMKERGFRPLEPYPGSTTPWLVQCKTCKNKFTTFLYSLKNKSSCKFCAGTAVDVSLALRHMKNLKLEPLVPFPGARVGWKSKCLVCQRVVSPDWSHVKNRTSGCAYCSKKRVQKEEIILLLKEQRIKPIDTYVNGRTPWKSKCLKCKKIIYVRVEGMRAGQAGCIYCAGVKVDEKDAVKLAEKCGFSPLVRYPGASTPWKCVCKVCGKISTPAYTTMQQRQSGCRYCKVGGFDFKKPAIIYLITHQEYGAHKIGVAGASEKNERLKKHSRQGWQIYKTKEFKIGEEVFAIEQQVLAWLISVKGLTAYLAAEQMPQGGSSETVDASEIELVTIWAKVEELCRVRT
jgi:hypothetical protein